MDKTKILTGLQMVGVGVAFIVLVFYILPMAACKTPRWEKGDTVCFKQTGSRGTVQFVHGAFIGESRQVIYKILSANNLDQMYTINVPEIDLVSCE